MTLTFSQQELSKQGIRGPNTYHSSQNFEINGNFLWIIVVD